MSALREGRRGGGGREGGGRGRKRERKVGRRCRGEVEEEQEGGEGREEGEGRGRKVGRRESSGKRWVYILCFISSAITMATHPIPVSLVRAVP